MSHTKGPWKVRWKTAFCNRAAIEPAIGEVYGAGDELRDNANLIAAAPELLEALEALMRIVSNSNGVSGWHRNGDIAGWDEFDEINMAIAALAKAKGE